MSTALFLGLILAFEGRERDIMRSPRDHEKRSHGPSDLSHLPGGMHGEGIDKARTAAVNMFVIGQAFYLLSYRSLALAGRADYAAGTSCFHLCTHN